jgi:hypothetical protein
MTTAAPQTHPKPPTGQGKPPAPKTQSQAQVNKPSQGCPLLAEKPCDVDKLTLEVEVGSTKKKAEAKQIRRYEKVTDVKDSTVLQLLTKYDLIIDVLAQYPSREESSPKEKAKIQGRAEYHGRKCATQTHPLMIMHPGSEAPELGPAGMIVKGNQIGPKEFYATAFKADFGFASKGLGALFEIIKSFWPFASPKLIEVRAESCGIRARGDGQQQRRNLSSLVRIYRKDTYLVAIKLPPLGKYSHERSGTVTGPRERETKTEYSAGFGYAKGSTSTKTSHEGHEYSNERWRGGQGTSTGVTHKTEDGHTTRTLTQQQSGSKGSKATDTDGVISVEVEKELKRQGPIAIVIKRNDRDFEKELFGGEKKSLKQMLVDGLVKGVEAIAKAIETFNKLPQVGWKFEFSIAFFEGTIGVEVSRKDRPAPLANGRYYGLAYKVAGKIGMKVISLEASLSFGVDVKAMGTGIVAKIEGKVTLEVEVEAEFTIEDHKPHTEVGLKPEASFKGTAMAQASVLGWSLIDAKVSAKVCITMDDGKIEIDAHRGLELKGTLKRKKALLTGHIKAPWMKLPKEIDPPIELCGEKIIHKFG